MIIVVVVSLLAIRDDIQSNPNGLLIMDSFQKRSAQWMLCYAVQTITMFCQSQAFLTENSQILFGFFDCQTVQTCAKTATISKSGFKKAKLATLLAMIPEVVMDGPISLASTLRPQFFWPSGFCIVLYSRDERTVKFFSPSPVLIR